MKSSHLLLSATLMFLGTLTFAQSESAKSFEKLKTLAGTWEGSATTNDPRFNANAVHVFLRVTSMGNALMHEMNSPGQRENPITMLYMHGDRLLLTHYCDMGNGKTVAFDFVDAAGDIKHGLMHDVAFTFVDADHHIEDWTALFPGDKTVRVRIDLRRTK